MWLDRLQAVAKGTLWTSSSIDIVKVNEGMLSQLVSQGFDRSTSKQALIKTGNDVFAALMILTCPTDNSSQAEDGGDGACAAGDDDDGSDVAKQQRYLDYFKDLGDQYWGWQNESARRGRGFKGALKENFLPLLKDLRVLAATPPPFCDDENCYYPMSFIRRGLDECPSIREDRDRDRHRMSAGCAQHVKGYMDRIAGLDAGSFRNSLLCELIKETFAVLDRLVVKEVVSAVLEDDRISCLRTVTDFVSRFDEFSAISQQNPGLPGASGKISASELQPILRSLVLFVTAKAGRPANEGQLEVTASLLRGIAPLLSRNDPGVVSAVLSVMSAFVHSCTRLTAEESNRVLGSFFSVDGLAMKQILQLVSRSKNAKMHGGVVAILSSVCLHSRDVLAGLVAARPKAVEGAAGGGGLLLSCAAKALSDEMMHVRACGVLGLIEIVHGCVSLGHGSQLRPVPSQNLPSVRGVGGGGGMGEEARVGKRSCDAMAEEDMQEIELREVLDRNDEVETDEEYAGGSSSHGSRHRELTSVFERRRASIEFRLERLKRARARHEEPVAANDAEDRLRGSSRGGGGGQGGQERGGGAGRSSSTRSAGCRGGSSKGPGCGDVLGGVELRTGVKVKRGPDWKWSSQDGGEGSVGVVVSGTDKNSDGWVRVRWPNGETNGYRWGVEDAYDLEQLEASPFAAAMRSRDVKALRELATNGGGDVNGVFNGCTPLLELISLFEGDDDGKGSDAEMATALVTEFGADVNVAAVAGGGTALHAAVDKGRADMVSLLLSLGADATRRDTSGKTALDAAVKHAEGGRAASHAHLKEISKRNCDVIRALVKATGAADGGEEGARGANGCVLSLPLRVGSEAGKSSGEEGRSLSLSSFLYPTPRELHGEEPKSMTLQVMIRLSNPRVGVGRGGVWRYGEGQKGAKGKGVSVLSLGSGEKSESFGCSSGVHEGGGGGTGGLCVSIHQCEHAVIGFDGGDAVRVSMVPHRGKWCHVACVVNCATRKLLVYINGGLEASMTLTADPPTIQEAQDLQIGPEPAAIGGTSEYQEHAAMRLQGSIADVRLYCKAMEDEEVMRLYVEANGAADAHPLLLRDLSEGTCNVLVDALQTACVDSPAKSVADVRANIIHILAMVLPHCSPAAVSTAMIKPVLVMSLEQALASYGDALNVVAAGSGPRQGFTGDGGQSFEGPSRAAVLLSALKCVDSLMRACSTEYREPLQRCGAFGDIRAIAENKNVPGSEPLDAPSRRWNPLRGSGSVVDGGNAFWEASDYARYVVEKHFAEDEVGMECSEGEGGGTHAGSLVKAGLSEVRELLEDTTAEGGSQKALALLSSLLLSPHGIYSQELITSKVPDALVDFIRQNSEAASAAINGCMSADAKDALVTALRQAVEKIPFREAARLPWFLPAAPAPPHPPLGFAILSKLITIRFERRAGCTGVCDLAGAEVRVEPLVLVEQVRASLKEMLQSPPPARRDGRARDMCAMMSDFGEDGGGVGGGHGLLDHVRSLIDSEHSSALPLTRTFSALPPVHEWDRESSSPSSSLLSGATKRSLIIQGAHTAATASGSRAPGSGSSKPHRNVGGAGGAGGGGGEGDGGEGGARSRVVTRASGRKSLRRAAREEDSVAAPYSSKGGKGKDKAGDQEMDEEPHDVQVISLEIREGPARSALNHNLTSSSSSALGYGRLSSSYSRAGLQSSLSDESLGDDDEDEAMMDEDEDKDDLSHPPCAKSGAGAKEGGSSTGGQGAASGTTVVALRDGVTMFEILSELQAAQARDADAAAEDGGDRVDGCQPRGAASGGGGAGYKYPTNFWGRTFTVLYGTQDSCEAVGTAGKGRLKQPSGSKAAAKGSPAPNDHSQIAAEGEEELVEFPALSLLQCLADLLPWPSSLNQSTPPSPPSDSIVIDSNARRRSPFVSEALGQHVACQLEEPLSLASGVVSKIPWVETLCRHRSVIPLPVRQSYFTGTCFGASRSLASLRLSPDALDGSNPQHASSTLSGEVAPYAAHMRSAPLSRHAVVMGRYEEGGSRLLGRVVPFHSPDLYVPPLVHETVEIDHSRQGHEDRMSFMRWAELTLEAHAGRDTVLDVTWKGEEGHGSGPTRKFFEKVAAELSAESIEAEGGGGRVWRSAGDASKEGLFPAQLPEDNELRSNILSRLRLTGLFVAKALQQGQRPGLYLAKPLLKLVLGDSVCFDDVRHLDEALADGVGKVLEWEQEMTLGLCDPTMVNSKLCMMENSSGEQITCDNLSLYVDELKHECVKRLDVSPQVAAMREGIDLVFRWQSLKVFHAEELQHMLWSDIEWDMQGLVKIVLPGPSWPDGREQVTWLRELLISMSKHERRAFVRFVTASVCKPTPGNPIIIQPQVETASSSSSSSSSSSYVIKGVGEADKKLPTCRTCVNSLYLPNYSNAEVLQERLRVAMWEEHIAFD